MFASRLNLATWASKSSVAGARSLESKVLDAWVPTAYKNRPAFYTQEGRSYWKETAGKFAQRMLYVGMIKTYGKGIKFIGFAKDAERKYIDMNVAFASQNRDVLGELCADALLAEKVTALKQLNRSGTFKWDFHVDKPKTVHIVCAKADMGTGVTQHLSQLTVLMHTWQSLAMYDSEGNPSGGSAEKRKVKEYVVFERMVSEPGSTWKICKAWTCKD